MGRRLLKHAELMEENGQAKERAATRRASDRFHKAQAAKQAVERLEGVIKGLKIRQIEKRRKKLLGALHQTSRKLKGLMSVERRRKAQVRILDRRAGQKEKKAAHFRGAVLHIRKEIDELRRKETEMVKATENSDTKIKRGERELAQLRAARWKAHESHVRALKMIRHKLDMMSKKETEARRVAHTEQLKERHTKLAVVLLREKILQIRRRLSNTFKIIKENERREAKVIVKLSKRGGEMLARKAKSLRILSSELKSAKTQEMEAKHLAKEERKAAIKLSGLNKVFREKRLKMERATTTLRKLGEIKHELTKRAIALQRWRRRAEKLKAKKLSALNKFKRESRRVSELKRFQARQRRQMRMLVVVVQKERRLLKHAELMEENGQAKERAATR